MKDCGADVNSKAGCGSAKDAIFLGRLDHDLTWRLKPIDDGECKGNHHLLWTNNSG